MKIQANSGRNKDGTFKKGFSGNLKGKPKGSTSIVQRLKNKLKEIPKGQKKQYVDLIIDRWLNQALVAGDFKALREIVRYIDGMPVQKVKSENTNINTDVDLSKLNDKELEQLEWSLSKLKPDSGESGEVS